MKVRILLDQLTCESIVYRAGDIVDNPPPRLLELARGELVGGQRVAELVCDEPIRRTRRRK